MTEPAAQSPLLPLPWAVWVLLLPIAAVEAVLQAAALGWIGGPEGIGWRLAAVERFGLAGALLSHQWETGRLGWAEAARLWSFMAVHPSGLVAVLALALIAALGKAVGQVLPGPALLVLAGVAAPVGALVWAVGLGAPVWLIGAYPAVFALLGAFAWLLWRGHVAQGADRQRFAALIGLLLVLRVAVGLWIGGGQDWIADLAAFAFGLAIAPGLMPGAMGRLRDRLRRRG